MRTRRPVAVLAVGVVAAACGGSAHTTAPTTAARRSAPRTVAPTTAAVTTVAPTTVAPTTVAPTAVAPTTVATTAVAPTTLRPTTTAAPATPAATRPAATPAPAPPLLVMRLSGVGNAGQVIAVSASGYGATTATFTAYQRTSSGWQQVFGPWTAHIGRNGFAPPGQKHEGDGRTPSGSYGFSFFFGVAANPGVHFPFRSIPGSWIVWDDDPSSANYNEWIDTRRAAAGANPEPMHVSAYAYGAVINYNSARTPGLGSAIFLHVSSGASTAGCVSLPTEELLPVLRWLDPGRAPHIIMGTQSDITS